MSKWAMVKDGVVENICLWDGNTETWQPPEGYDMVNVDNVWCDIGHAYVDGVFTAPEQTE